MKIHFVLSVLLLCSVSFGRERLVAFGGGNFAKASMDRFAHWAGGSGARTLSISFATETPAISSAWLAECLAPYGIGVELATELEFLTQLGRVNAVFFTGGDQVRLMEVMNRHPEWIEAIRKRFGEGMVVGGNSAGTAILSDRMFTGSGDFGVVDPAAIQLVPGFGLLAGVLLDQHFIRRGRLNRMLSALLQGHETKGLGIDEGTSAAIEDNRWVDVLGETAVMEVTRKESKQGFDLKIHVAGTRFELIY